MNLGEPLSEERRAEIARIVESSKKIMDEYYEKKKTQPRLNFISAAVRAGFTEAQANFLWKIDRHTRPLW